MTRRLKSALKWFLGKTGTLGFAQRAVFTARRWIRATRSAYAKREFTRDNEGHLADPSYAPVRHRGHWLVAKKMDSLRVIDVAQANLELAADVIERAGADYFLIEISSVNRYRLGVSDSTRSPIWKALRQVDDPSIYVYYEDGGKKRVKPARSAASSRPPSGPVWRLFRAVCSSDGSMPFADLQGCEIEFWEPVGANKLTETKWNTVTDTVDLRKVGSETVSIGNRLYPTIRRRTSLEFFDRVTFPVDLVYTWVDGSDPAWLERKNTVLEALGVERLSADAASESRFQDREELRYSLRSVEMFADFVRRIFIVTDKQIPHWLDTDHPQIEIVDHETIFGDVGQLPTFNSHAIEARLHHIPGLAEHYVYMNDDFFFGRRVRADSFFTANGLQKMFLSPARIGLSPPSHNSLGVDNGAKNGRELVERHFGVTYGRKFKHAPYPQRRSVNMALEKAFAEELERTASHQLRHPDDVATASSVSHYFAFLTGHAIPGRITSRYVGLDDPKIAERLEGLLGSRDFDSLCLNDTDLPPDAADRVDRLVTEFLRSYFPFKSRFER